jgi:hypothetical protein
MNEPDDRYHEFVERASDAINDYDIDKCRIWLHLAASRRHALDMERSIAEFEVESLCDKTEEEYPVPDGLKRAGPGPGCGDPTCQICYKEKRR